MELDELKQSWQKLGTQEQQLGERELKKVLQSSSSSPLSKIRKNMMTEIISILVILLAFYAFVLSQQESSKWLYIGLGVLTAISLLILAIVFPRLYKHTQKFKLAESISNSLERNIAQLRSDLDLYEKTMLFLYVPACFAGFALSNNFNLYIILFFVLFSPVYYWIVKKWTTFFYGQYVEELDQLYAELEESQLEEDE